MGSEMCIRDRLFPDGPSVGNVALSVNVDESTIGIVDDTLRVLDSGIGTAQIADGSIRSEDIGTGEILAGNIATGAVGSEELATIPTVTPGSYANASITVDEDGRITAASDGEVAGIGGTGNANYIPKFSDDHNITNSTIYETSDGRIGIGTASIDATAGLELSGTGKGLLIYRMSETEREAITNPATGLLIYNTDSNCFNMFNGTTWKQSCFDCAFTPSVASSNSPICEGETLELYASTVTDATYHWTGPNSFDSDLQNPTITNVTTSASGVYYLTTTKEGCTSEPTNTNVTINTAPATPSAIDGPSEVCEGATGVSYSIAPVPGANYYNWSVPSGASITSGQGNTNILMDFGSNSGDISVTATNTTNDCGSSAPNSKTVTVHSLPTSTFTPTEALVGINTTFTPTVSGASYNWSFSSGSPSSSTEENPSVSWSSAGTYDVTLTVTDANGCTSTTTTPVTVSIPISCLDIKNTVSDATDGVYTIDVSFVNRNNQKFEDSLEFTLDTQIPTIKKTTPAHKSQLTFSLNEISVQLEDKTSKIVLSDTEVRLIAPDGEIATQRTDNGVNLIKLSFEPLKTDGTQDGVYRIEVSPSDLAGNKPSNPLVREFSYLSKEPEIVLNINQNEISSELVDNYTNQMNIIEAEFVGYTGLSFDQNTSTLTVQKGENEIAGETALSENNIQCQCYYDNHTA